MVYEVQAIFPTIELTLVARASNPLKRVAAVAFPAISGTKVHEHLSSNSAFVLGYLIVVAGSTLESAEASA